MCFKSSRRLLSLSSTIVFLDHISAIYVVFLEISICFLLQVLFLYCLATSGGRFSAPLSCHVWKSWHTYRVSSVYYYIRSFFRLGFFLRSLFSHLRFYRTRCPIDVFFLYCLSYYCKNYFICQSDTYMRPNILNILTFDFLTATKYNIIGDI